MSLQEWIKTLNENREETLSNRRYLHEHPELSFEEKETAAFIRNQLQSYGIEDIRSNVGNGYGLVATIHGEHPGPTIALRADFDALKITEQADVSFVSKNTGVMHACGHDVHTAALLSVAKVLQQFRTQLKGSVVLLHQNAEEVVPGGAKSMVEAGALDGVDYVFGIHVSSGLPAGKVGYCVNYGSAGSDSFVIHIQGKGGHAARPHQTHDAVIIASQIITNLQTIVSRKVDPVQPAVLTFASVDAGGEAANVIADRADIYGTIRTLNDSVRKFMKKQLYRYSEISAEGQDGKVSIDFIDGYPSIINTPEEVDVLVGVLHDYFGKENVVEIPVGLGGEDFAYYLKEKPGAFFYVGGENEAIKANYPHHHPMFKLDEQCLYQSGEAFLALVAKYLL